MTSTIKLTSSLLIGVVIGYFLAGQLNKNSVQVSEGSLCLDSPICCDSATFCGLSVEELKHYVSNYQNFNWARTSKYYSDGYEEYNCETKADFLTFSDQDRVAHSIPVENSTSDLFDAALMDISIADMENYICAVKNSNLFSSGREDAKGCCKEPEILRFYYIRYDGPDGKKRNGFQDYDDNYNFKHSLAIVPVCVNESDKTECLAEDDHFNTTFIWAPRPDCERSVIANHNQICPPLIGWDEKTILQQVYGDDNLYSIDQNYGRPCSDQRVNPPCGTGDPCNP